MYIITANNEDGIMLHCPHCQHTVYCRHFNSIRGQTSISPYYQAAKSIQEHMDGHQNRKRGIQSEDRMPQ